MIFALHKHVADVPYADPFFPHTINVNRLFALTLYTYASGSAIMRHLQDHLCSCLSRWKSCGIRAHCEIMSAVTLLCSKILVSHITVSHHLL